LKVLAALPSASCFFIATLWLTLRSVSETTRFKSLLFQ
jgi:hypothetical protein